VPSPVPSNVGAEKHLRPIEQNTAFEPKHLGGLTAVSAIPPSFFILAQPVMRMAWRVKYAHLPTRNLALLHKQELCRRAVATKPLATTGRYHMSTTTGGRTLFMPMRNPTTVVCPQFSPNLSGPK
jgi:hypothetical protein